MEATVSITYYDKVLVAIAASLGGGALAGLLGGVSFQLGLLMGALIATVVLYDAIYRNPPVPETEPGMTAVAVVWHFFLGGLLLWVLV